MRCAERPEANRPLSSHCSLLPTPPHLDTKASLRRAQACDWAVDESGADGRRREHDDNDVGGEGHEGERTAPRKQGERVDEAQCLRSMYIYMVMCMCMMRPSAYTVCTYV